jgi:hypothetical protein
MDFGLRLLKVVLSSYPTTPIFTFTIQEGSKDGSLVLPMAQLKASIKIPTMTLKMPSVVIAHLLEGNQR